MQKKLRIPKKELAGLQTDSKKYAEAVQLVYAVDTMPGIVRKKKGKYFTYLRDNKQVRDRKTLERIKKLVIPPAWEQVWISTNLNAHLQVTGFDERKRKQYKYHPEWELLRNETKFHRLHSFGKALPKLRRQVEKDLRRDLMTQDKVIATVLNLMEQTAIRIGNTGYEKEYGSFGLTTLKNRHVKLKKDHIRFSFIGKKGVPQNITLKSKRMARIVRQCLEIPGQELFQYIDENGERHALDSGKVNDYIKKFTGDEMTAKDFRTWFGSLSALRALMDVGEEAVTDKKQTLKNVLKIVSKQLGNTPAVCKKYYVLPALISLFENDSLKNIIANTKSLKGLKAEESMLMTILRKNS